VTAEGFTIQLACTA